MGVIQTGDGTGGLLSVNANTKAARMSDYPTDVGSMGAYAIDTVSGTFAAGLGAAAPVYSCRWSDATRLMLVRGVYIQALHVATAFTQGFITIDMVVARSFTVADSAGASILPVTSSQKKKTNFGTTLINDLRQSTTATLTAGTRTLDTQPIAAYRGIIPATQINYPMISPAFAPAAVLSSGGGLFPLFVPELNGSWPLVLTTNEGFILRATVPATGTWNMSVRLVWEEITASGSGYA